MDKLKTIEEAIRIECSNIEKSKNNVKTLELVITKEQFLNESLRKLEGIVNSFEHRLRRRDFIDLLKTQETLRTLTKKAINILDNSKLSERIRVPKVPSTSNLNINAGKTELEVKNLDTLQVPPLKVSGTSRSIQNLEQIYTGYEEIKNRKMADEFPMHTVIQCIPEFTGLPEELDAFLEQIDYFIRKLQPQPAEVNAAAAEQNAAAAAQLAAAAAVREQNQVPEHETAIINIVLMKLKGNAAKISRRIRAPTWELTKANLINEFSEKITMEEVMTKIETLEQGPRETYDKYKDRALVIKTYIDALPNNDQGGAVYAERTLKIHFLAGLQNSHLKQIGTASRKKPFVELVNYLKEECDGCEQVVNIEKRLKSVHVGDQRRYNNDNRNQWTNSNYNYRNNNPPRPNNNNNQRQTQQRGNNNRYNNNANNYNRSSYTDDTRTQEPRRDNQNRSNDTQNFRPNTSTAQQPGTSGQNNAYNSKN